MNNKTFYFPNGDNAPKTDAATGKAAATAKKPKKQIKPMSKRDLLFSLAFIGVSFIIVDFAVFNGFNLGFTIAFFILFAVVTAYLYKKEVKPSAFSVICGVLSLAGSVTFAIFRDVFQNCIMLFLVCALFTIYSCGISGTFRNKEGSYKVLADAVLGVLASPFENFGNTVASCTSAFSKNKNVLYTIIGIAVALPVLFIVVPLLSSSDAAFAGLVVMLLKNIGIYLIELILAIIVSPYVISYMFSKRRNLKVGSELAAKSHGSLRHSPNAVSVAFLSAISFVYVVYLFSQLAYFFSAFSGILPKGYEFNASGYARRGFFEMFAISAINIALISLVNIFTKRVNGGKISRSVKALSAFISLFSVLLLSTAMSKMVLYIKIFGLTKRRFLVSVFMVMLFVIIGFYLVHIFAPRVSYMQPIIIICSAIFIAISFADMDKQIVKYNIEAYNAGKIESLDVSYLNELTASAAPYIVELANSEDVKISTHAKTEIKNNIHCVYDDRLSVEDDELKYNSSNDFRGYNYSDDVACKAYCDYFNSLRPENKIYFKYMA